MVCCLAVYKVKADKLTLLDTVELEGGWNDSRPRVDSHINQLYVPTMQGVSVVRCDDGKLVTRPSLTCVSLCCSVGLVSSQTLCVCNYGNNAVSVVSVHDNRVTGRLSKPRQLQGDRPHSTAVLGDTVLVSYGDILVVHDNGVSSPGTMVTNPKGLLSVRSISTDDVSRFLLSDSRRHAVFILDPDGEFCDKIRVDTVSEVEDCTVGDGRLWVGCENGDIIVMSSQ